MTEVMDRDEVIPMVNVPEREIADLEITVNTEPEHTSDDSSSWAEQTAQAEPTPSHSDENFRPSYPSHLRSKIMEYHPSAAPDCSSPARATRNFCKFNYLAFFVGISSRNCRPEDTDLFYVQWGARS